jgi:exonuclease SbcC
MILKKVALKNIRSHLKLELDFDRGITVVTGRTGSGKSTILMAVEYALFGNESGINYSSLLRRGCARGSIKLVFEHEGDEYEIVRGFVRKSSGISFDKDALSISVNKQVIPVIARVKDFDEKIKRLLGYDANMFSIMSYTRQDEIRKLIELRSERRQEYIDEVLQLSKYKLSWNNLKEVVTQFNNKIIQLEAETAFKKELESEIKSFEKEYSENKKEKENLEQEIKGLSAELEESRKKYEGSVERKKKLESLFEKRVAATERKEYLKERFGRLKKAVEQAESEMPGESVGEVKNLEEEHERIMKQSYSNSAMLSVHHENLEKISGISEGVCPTCKQRVNREHLQGVKGRINKEVELLKSGLEALEKREEEVKERLEASMQRRDLSKKVEELRIDMLEVKKEMKAIVVGEDYSLKLKKAREKYDKNLKEFREIFREQFEQVCEKTC